jgi:hypothetical protein
MSGKCAPIRLSVNPRISTGYYRLSQYAVKPVFAFGHDTRTFKNAAERGITGADGFPLLKQLPNYQRGCNSP